MAGEWQVCPASFPPPRHLRSPLEEQCRAEQARGGRSRVSPVSQAGTRVRRCSARSVSGSEGGGENQVLQLHGVAMGES